MKMRGFGNRRLNQRRDFPCLGWLLPIESVDSIFPSMNEVSARYFYDIFISHNRADKAWVRTLADRLAVERLHGRALRPWLDEKFLDPGGLASEAELTTAIDRSRLVSSS